MTVAHNPLGPSSLFRRALCPGSYWAEKDLPSEDSAAAAAGTDLHGKVSGILTGNMVPPIPEEGEWVEQVQSCLAVAERLRSGCAEGVVVAVEESLALDCVAPGVSGTLDYALAEPFGKGAVVDWKFGHGDVAPARVNLQVQAYAAGWRRKHELEEVTGVIVCAATGRISEHTWSASDLDLIEARLQQIARSCLAPWAPRVTSEDACRYCRARTTCTALLVRVEQFRAKAEGKDIGALAGVDLQRLLDMAGAVIVWAQAVKGRAHTLLEAGGEVPGWTLAPGRATRAWADTVTADQLQQIGALLEKPVDGLTRSELVTVAQLEKKWGKGRAVVTALEGLIVKKVGESRLARAEETKEED